MWHQAQFRDEELIVIGYNTEENSCLVVKLSGLPLNEQQDLRRIAASRAAQERKTLVPILQRMPAPDGGDWFSYLAKKMVQRNGPVLKLPLKEIQDSLDNDQKAIFKGYGKGRRNTSLDRLDLAESNSWIDNDGGITGDVDPIGQSTGSLDQKIGSLIETVTGESRRTQELLNRLVMVLTSDAEEKPVKRARATNGRVRGKRKATGEGNDEVVSI